MTSQILQPKSVTKLCRGRHTFISVHWYKQVRQDETVSNRMCQVENDILQNGLLRFDSLLMVLVLLTMFYVKDWTITLKNIQRSVSFYDRCGVCDQCDQIWQNLRSFRQLFKSYFIIWHTFEPTLTNLV